MFKLTIFNPDLSVYWIEHFNTQAELDKWFAEEQTRPYWNRKFTHQIEDLTPPEKTSEEKAQEEFQRVDRINVMNELKTLKVADMNNIAEVKNVLIKVLKVIGIQ